MSLDTAIMLLFGPPYNRSLEEIGWLTRRRISKLALSYRNKEGLLDIDMVEAEERSKKYKDSHETNFDPYAPYKQIRRLQGVPEYLINKEIRDKENEYVRKRTSNPPLHSSERSGTQQTSSTEAQTS